MPADSPQCPQPQCDSVGFRTEADGFDDCFRVGCQSCRVTGPWGLSKLEAIEYWGDRGRREDKTDDFVGKSNTTILREGF